MSTRHNRTIDPLNDVRPKCANVYCTNEVPPNRTKHCSDICKEKQRRWREQLSRAAEEAEGDTYLFPGVST